MKGKVKLISTLITLGVLFLMMAVITMVIHLLSHYLVLIIQYLPTLLPSAKAASTIQPDLTFHMGYLFTTIPQIDWYLPWLFSALLIMMRGRRMVLQISHRIVSMLPHATPDIEGSARWATAREIKKYLVAIPRTHISKANHAGILLAQDDRHYFVDVDTVNTLVIGTTRSGKGQLPILNTIRLASQCKQPESFVVFDFKGDNVEYSYTLLQKGYDVYIINLDNPKQSHRRDPLAYIKKTYLRELQEGGDDFSETVELTNELAHTITNDPTTEAVWSKCSQSLLSAIILFLLEDGYKRNVLDKLNMFSVFNFFLEYGGKENKVGKQTVNALDQLLSALPVGHPAKMAYTASKFAQGDMRASIFAILASDLQIFADSGIARLTSGNDVDFGCLAVSDRPCAVFLVVPEGKTTRYMIATLFITQCYSELLDIAKTCPRKRLNRKVRFVLDELGNMPNILNFTTKITTALQHNIVFDLYIQSLAQLEEKYGRLQAVTIRENCGNKVYLNSLDPDTNNWFSKMLGPGTVEYQTYSSENGAILEKNRMSHYKSRPLKMPNELPEMPFGDMVVVRQRCHPILTHLEPFYKLQLPITPIANIALPPTIGSLKEILYPITSIPTPVCEKAPTSMQKTAEKTDAKLQGVLNNMDILTHGKFKHALEKTNANVLYTMITKYQESGQLNMEQAELLENYVDDKMSKKE